MTSESLHRPFSMFASHSGINDIDPQMATYNVWGHYHLMNVVRVCYRNLTAYGRALRTVDINA